MKYFPRPFILSAFTLVAICEPVLLAERPVRPINAIEHVLLISIDGLRPDMALLADMPALRALLRDGSYTFWARTTPNCITLPSHTSLLTGVDPRKHGIEWNQDLPLSTPVYPQFPTIFEMATKAGYRTAIIAGKSKFAVLARPGTVTTTALPSAPSVDNAWVTAAATSIIEKQAPELIFVHYPEIDAVGHAKGWGSPEQLATIEATDCEVGKVLAALTKAHLTDTTLIILTADHGGAGFSHGPDDPRSRNIPWIAVGPCVRKNYDLTQEADTNVRIEDTAATALLVLGLTVPKYFDGHAQYGIFETAAALEFAAKVNK